MWGRGGWHFLKETQGFKVEALKDSLRTYLTHVKIEKPTNMQEISDIKEFYIWYQISQKYNNPPTNIKEIALTHIRAENLDSQRVLPDTLGYAGLLRAASLTSACEHVGASAAQREESFSIKFPLLMEAELRLESRSPTQCLCSSSMPLLFKLNSHKKPWILTSWMLELEE